ncbi:tRNA adenosine(34) deaminase TadA [Erysipelothrix larvae]|uniref:tRNA adenosine(34) deaminase TadA n=1 Tax=Erysipelothrix larvae TaxID=1514105 RepID=UPI000A4839A5
MNHETYMKEALIEAKKALEHNDVPIGAVVVRDETIIARSYNKREYLNDPTAHAEVLALREAGKNLNNWNLSDCTLYVTIEPCPMCAGATILSRIGTVVYGAKEPKGGSLGSTFNMLEISGFNHYPNQISGILEEECRGLVMDFFKEKRKEQIKVKHIHDQDLFEKALSVRKEVFVIEQQVDETLEYDEYDDIARDDVIHLAAIQNESVLGTLRLISKGKTLKVGRVAVLKSSRGLHIGAKLMDAADRYARNSGYDTLELDAQLYAIPFYEKQGFTTHGGVFLDANIEHKKMTKKL